MMFSRCCVPSPQPDVMAKAKLALEQVAIYARHLQANPKWRTHHVTALVGYDGPKRFRCDNPDLMLVCVGDASPSDGATLLDIGGLARRQGALR